MWATFQNVLIYAAAKEDKVVTIVKFPENETPQVVAIKLDLDYDWFDIEQIGFINNHLLVTPPTDEEFANEGISVFRVDFEGKGLAD